MVVGPRLGLRQYDIGNRIGVNGDTAGIIEAGARLPRRIATTTPLGPAVSVELELRVIKQLAAVETANDAGRPGKLLFDWFGIRQQIDNRAKQGEGLWVGPIHVAIPHSEMAFLLV